MRGMNNEGMNLAALISLLGRFREEIFTFSGDFEVTRSHSITRTTILLLSLFSLRCRCNGA